MDQTNQRFTEKDVWFGGYYELAIELGDRSDERLRAALTAIWSYPSIKGWYQKSDIEPHAQPILPPAQAPIDSHAYGLTSLLNGNAVVCGTCTVREDDGPDWVIFYIPMAALGRAVDVRAYPFDANEVESLNWRTRIDASLQELGRSVYTVAPFKLALIGHEVSGESYSSELRADGLPSERHMSYLWPVDGQLQYAPANH